MTSQEKEVACTDEEGMGRLRFSSQHVRRGSKYHATATRRNGIEGTL
jgi:hypothetical protein